MKEQKRNVVRPFFFSLFLSLGFGALSAMFVQNSRQVYQTLHLPPLAPPGWLFPLVWTVLYILMGVSAWLVWRQGGPGAEQALRLYAAQLLVNVIWPFLFFGMQAYWLAFFWLLLLLVLVVMMIVSFYRVQPVAAYLQIPYLLWLLFAAYLNLAVAILN